MKYTAEKVRAHLCFNDGTITDTGREMLRAYAERIEADEGAVPVAEVYEYPREIQTWNSPMVRAVRFLGASPLPIGTKLFIHPPAQAAQVDFPACSGDPSSCPENEGYGCCKAPSHDPTGGIGLSRFQAQFDDGDEE